MGVVAHPATHPPAFLCWGMGIRPVFTVLFVMLSLEFMGTYAQSSTTTTATTTMTPATTVATTTMTPTTTAATTTTPTTTAATTTMMPTTTVATTTMMPTTTVATTTMTPTTTVATTTMTPTTTVATTTMTPTTTAATTTMTPTTTAATTTTPTTTTATTTTPTTTTATTTTPTTTAATTTTPTTTAATTTTPTTTAATTTTTATTASTASTVSPTTATTVTTATTATTASTASPTTTTTASTALPTTPAIASACPVPQTSVNRSQCATQKLCAAEPSGCDPSTDTSCFFTSAQQNSGQIFTFQLTGESTGFVAVILSPDSTPGSNNTAYVCVNNNSMVDVRSAIFGSNNTLTTTTLGVTCVSGRINGDRIECTFNATIPDSTARTTSFSLSILNGTFNSTSGGLGNTNEVLRSPVLNLAQPNVTVINVLNNSTNTTTTTAPTTTAHAITLKQSVMQVLLITVATLGLSML